MTITINPLILGFIIGILFTLIVEITIGIIVVNKQNKK